MLVTKHEDVYLTQGTQITVKEVGNKVTVTHRTNAPTEYPTQRLDGNFYLVKSTGEVKAYKTSKSKADNKHIYATFKRMRDLIKHNFSGNEGEYLMTLTYAKPQNDTEQLKRDVQIFIKEARKLVKFDYINIVEPHKSGDWHCHLLIKLDKNTPCSNLIHSNWGHLWKHGFSKIQPIYDPNGLAWYLSKADRLDLYPPNLRIYRKSTGIQTPPKLKMTKDEFDSEYQDYNLVKSTVTTVTHEGKKVNTITKQTYKKRD